MINHFKPQKLNLKIIGFLWFLFFSNLIFGQNITQTIRGNITDNDNQEPLVAATVFIPKLELGVTSDESGNFIFQEIPIGRYQMRISFVGYETLVISEVLLESAKETVLEISLEKSNAELDEIVVKAIVPDRLNRVVPSAEIMTIEEIQKKNHA